MYMYICIMVYMYICIYVYMYIYIYISCMYAYANVFRRPGISVLGVLGLGFVGRRGFRAWACFKF